MAKNCISRWEKKTKEQLIELVMNKTEELKKLRDYIKYLEEKLENK